MPHFLDSSALVKGYVTETGSPWVRALLDPKSGTVLHIAGITGVETVAALARRRRGGTLSPTDVASAIAQFRRDYARRLNVFLLTPALFDDAMRLAELHALRGYDAVHLAAALSIRDALIEANLALTFVCADAELLAVAARQGLGVENPNLHS